MVIGYWLWVIDIDALGIKCIVYSDETDVDCCKCFYTIML